jgi:hypothetical protein
MNKIKFSLSQQVYTQGGSVESNCEGMIFINIGTDTVTVLGYPIISNGSFTPPCNVGETDITNYIAQFEGVAVNQTLLVIRKHYL